MKVDWNDVKEDYKRKDDKIEALEQQLAELKASLPKVRADALSDFSNQMNKHSENAAIKGELEFSSACKFAAKVASEQAKLEAGNE